MRRFPIVLAVLVVASRGAAADVRVIPDVPYLGAGRSEKADLYFPPPATGGAPAPAVIWIHGGSLTSGDKAKAPEKRVASDLAAAGYVVASINYKLGGGAWPQDVRDCKNAVRFLRANAGAYHVDPDRIAVAGGSAGGYLALMVGFTAGNPRFEPSAPYPGVSSRVNAVIDLYGDVDFLTRQQCTSAGVPTGKLRTRIVDSPAVFGAKSREDPIYREASAVTYVTQDSPPVLIGHGRADPQVDYLQSVELARVLEEHGVAHELILMEGVGHAFDLETWRKRPLPHDMRASVAGFLAKHVAGAEVKVAAAVARSAAALSLAQTHPTGLQSGSRETAAPVR